MGLNDRWAAGHDTELWVRAKTGEAGDDEHATVVSTPTKPPNH